MPQLFHVEQLCGLAHVLAATCGINQRPTTHSHWHRIISAGEAGGARRADCPLVTRVAGDSCELIEKGETKANRPPRGGYVFRKAEDTYAVAQQHRRWLECILSPCAFEGRAVEAGCEYVRARIRPPFDCAPIKGNDLQRTWRSNDYWEFSVFAEKCANYAKRGRFPEGMGVSGDPSTPPAQQGHIIWETAGYTESGVSDASVSAGRAEPIDEPSS